VACNETDYIADRGLAAFDVKQAQRFAVLIFTPLILMAYRILVRQYLSHAGDLRQHVVQFSNVALVRALLDGGSKDGQKQCTSEWRVSRGELAEMLANANISAG
jgi:hypothetical protein